MTRTAVVTGAAGGIGQAAVEAALSRGWTVHAWDVRPGQSDGPVWREVDVGDPAQVAEAAAWVPRCDLLFNAAGIALMAPVAEMTPEQWDRVLRVNLTGTFLCCRALQPALRAAQGVVVNVASTRAYQPAAGRAAYAVSKAGVVMLTQMLGLEWAADRIRVVGIAPGYVRTPMVQHQLDIGGLREDVILGNTPLQRMAEPAEVAELVLALCEPTFSFMTGTTLVYDGGWLTKGVL